MMVVRFSIDPRKICWFFPKYFQKLMRPLPILFISTLVVFSSLTADDSDSYLNYLSSGINHSVSDRTNQIILGSAIVGGLLLRGQDVPLRDSIQPDGFMSKQLSHGLDLYGNGWAYGTAIIGVGVLSYREGGKSQMTRDLRYLTTSLGTTAALTYLLKWTVGRKRPNGNDHRSFPSGHTSASFALAASMDKLYGHRIGLPAYLIATAVAAQRIHDNKHWLTDVIAGAALGTVIGRGYGNIHEEERTADNLNMTTSLGQQGLQFAIVIPLRMEY